MVQIGGHRGGSFLTAVLTMALVAGSAAQGDNSTQTCASNLVACVNYINGTTTPPAECCNTLKEAITNQRTCLCNIYSDNDLLNTLKINKTLALQLPKRCNLDTGKTDNICEAVSPSSSTTDSSPSPPAVSPSSSTTDSSPSPPGGNGSGSKSGSWIVSVIGSISTLLIFKTYA